MSVLKVTQGDKTEIKEFVGPVRLSELLGLVDVHIDALCAGRGVCKKCTVKVNGKNQLACQYIASDDIEVVLPKEQEIVSVTGVAEGGRTTKNTCLCLDIGTTTLALALVSLDDKRIIKTKTAPNPQRKFGADVISRIEYCTKHGVENLQNVLLSGVANLIDEIFAEYNLQTVEKMYVAGNTTMLHLFFGVDCASLGVSPYTPEFLSEQKASGKSLGFDNVKNVVSLPAIAAFVGADIVSALGYLKSPEKGKYSLLIDLGTNAEIVLFGEGKYFCTAAAAGPCFEGVNISCGMSASKGAISSYTEDRDISVIGGGEPKGICATGLIDIIACLVKNSTVDQSGYMEHDFKISENLNLTACDIREFQLAKSAVMSGIQCLLKYGNIEYDKIESMYVAGGFSASLNIQNAAFVGLIPKELTDKFVAVNNSSLIGAVNFACKQNNLDEIVNSAEYVDLAANNTFSELFFLNMMF